MRNGIVLIIFVSIFISLNSQTIAQLDIKKGFKDFQIGDSYAKWSKDLIYLKTESENVKIYQYKGDCCLTIFDYEIDRIVLTFKDEKLVVISIVTKKFQKPFNESNQYTKWRVDDFQKINNAFINLFGKETQVVKNDKTVEITYIWKAINIILFSTYNYLGVKNGDYQDIIIVDITFYSGLLSKDF